MGGTGIEKTRGLGTQSAGFPLPGKRDEVVKAHKKFYNEENSANYSCLMGKGQDYQLKDAGVFGEPVK